MLPSVSTCPQDDMSRYLQTSRSWSCLLMSFSGLTFFLALACLAFFGFGGGMFPVMSVPAMKSENLN